MERHIWRRCEDALTLFTSTESANRRRPYLEALASARALIVNPSTSDETISRVLETLARSLQHDREPLLVPHVLKLLSDLAFHHRHLCHAVFDTIHAYALVCKDSSRLTAEALAVLVAITEHNQSSSSSSPMAELNEDFVISLCLSSSASVRSWLLFNAERFLIRPCLLVTLLLGFTKDPYPFVRRAALGGLVGLSNSADIKDRGLIEGCYDCAVELLQDTNGCVRSAAIHVVSEWGQMLAKSDHEVGNRDRFDAVFVQLCSMVRDMSVEVRIEAFLALGKIKLVSEDILLQTLSKKILGIIKERKIIGYCTTKGFDLLASDAAGAFVHGLEDEFYEVRRSACNSLGMLTIFSVQFATDALTLLMDLLNDDSTDVRLQTLETMYHMATRERLKVQEMHMHMFLGTLVDASTLIRCAARNILRLIKLPVLEMFKSSINGLLTNLETYPEDEADIFSSLYDIGRIHGNFAVSFVKEVSQEIEPSCEGELAFDNARVAAILVLAIAAPLSHEQRDCNIPTRIFSYAVSFLGRISRSLRDVINPDTLLAYLFHRSRFVLSPAAESFREDELVLPVVEGLIPNHNNKIINQVSPLRQSSNETSEIQFQNHLWDPRHATSVEEYQQKVTVMHVEATTTVKLILKMVAETWPLIKSGSTDEVRRTLRTCKEELVTMTMDSHGSVGLLAFASQYVRVIQLLAKVWEHFLPPRKLHGNGMGMLDILLEKLDSSVRGMRYSFSGLSKEEESHVLELILLTCVLRLSKVEICCYLTTVKILHATLSHIELLCEGFIELSDFTKELKKAFCQGGSSNVEAFYYSFPFKRFLEFFYLRPFVFGGRFKHIKAELDVPGNNSENPLPFISGLPVGITFQITLYNVSNEDRLWLRMAVEELTQYVYVDLNHIGDGNEVRKVTLSLLFYETPKAASFSLRACIGRECPFEDVAQLTKGWGGPKHELTYLCNEKEVYMVMVKGND